MRVIKLFNQKTIGGELTLENRQITSGAQTTDEVDLTVVTGYDRDPNLKIEGPFKPGTKSGFIRLQLNSSFYHNIYPTLLTEAVTSKSAALPYIFSRTRTRSMVEDTADNFDVPNPPYTPATKSITLDYTSSVTAGYESVAGNGTASEKEKNIKEKYKTRTEQFFHLTPFGHVEVYPVSNTQLGTSQQPDEIVVTKDLIPQFDASDAEGGEMMNDPQGTLYIGIKDLDPPQNLSLYFGLAEGTENTELEAPEVRWSFLQNNQWVPFDPDKIIIDTTNGLINSGVITFELSRFIDTDNTLFPEKLHWIRASTPDNTDAFSHVIDIRTQSVEARYSPANNDPERVADPIPAGVISKLVLTDSAVKTVEQPLASFGGRVREKNEHYYNRVSERLRHKQRAITIHDYERLVLEEFSQVIRVKCINHMDTDSELSPGSVTIVVVPDPKTKTVLDNLELRASVAVLESIEAYLARISSMFVNIDVRNPLYEQIRLDFAVDFRKGIDRAYYQKQLHTDIQKFLAPWAFGNIETITFGGEVHRGVILNHIEELPYVDYITDFKMDHLVNGTLYKADVTKATATTAGSILVANTIHTISETTNTNC